MRLPRGRFVQGLISGYLLGYLMDTKNLALDRDLDRDARRTLSPVRFWDNSSGVFGRCCVGKAMYLACRRDLSTPFFLCVFSWCPASWTFPVGILLEGTNKPGGMAGYPLPRCAPRIHPNFSGKFSFGPLPIFAVNRSPP